MASHLVGQHQQTSFATPVNGAAGDATVVLGNDNATVTTYNAHDIDPTIHVQDSSAAVFGATPAGTAGRKWMTNDTGAIYLYFDTGSAWVEVNYQRTSSTGAVVIVSTSTPQLTVEYDGTHTSTFSVSSAGALTINATSTVTITPATTISGAVTHSSTLLQTGVATFTAQPILSSLTASQAVFTDSSKGLVSNAITGTGNVVMSASPTFTGTAAFATVTTSGTLTTAGTITNSGTGSVLLRATNTTAVNGRAWYLNSFNDGALYIGNDTAGDLVSIGKTGGFNVLTGTTAVQALTATTVSATSGYVSTGLGIAAGASQLSMGYSGGGLIIAYGANASTNATISIQSRRSDASNPITLISSDVSGNLTFGAGITATTGTFSSDISVATTKKVGLNAGLTTYVIETTPGNIVDIFVGSVSLMTLTKNVGVAINSVGLSVTGGSATNLSGGLSVGGATASTAGIALANATPAGLADGQIWWDGSNYKGRVGGVTKTFTVT